MQDQDISVYVHQAEVDLARTEVRKAIANASKVWTSGTAINDALFLEFLEKATQCTSSADLAAQLSHVAEKLRSSPSPAH